MTAQPEQGVPAATRPPGLMFSHYGIFCTDHPRLLDFYMRVLGFGISDQGLIMKDTVPITFMTRRPREHHQFVLVGGRDAAHPTTVSEVGFKAPDLDELRKLAARLKAEPGVHDMVAADHGISWTLYFRDPEGIRISVSVETGHYVPQPAQWPLDLSQSDDEIIAATEERVRGCEGHMERDQWRAQKEAQYRAEQRLTAEAPETGNPNPSFERPKDPNRTLVEIVDGDTPRIAMAHVGYRAADLEALTDFYTRVLGYAVTGRGRMDAIGKEPARDYVYLSRDPAEHHQVILTDGRDLSVPSSVNQLSLRVTSLDELRHMEKVIEAEGDNITSRRDTCHGNSFSIYFGDPEGNIVELAVESVWYVPAPHGAPLDLSLKDDELIAWAEDHCRETPGFMMRADWKARARQELLANGHIEAEGLVSDVA